MKKYVIAIMSLLLVLASACGIKQNTQEEDSMEVKTMESTAATKTEVHTDNETMTEAATEDMKTDNKIRITTPDGDIIVILEDNSASADLLKRLPMTVHFEDFNSTEKISYIDGKLDTSDVVTEYTPLAGAFAYYIPWGNLSLFYEDFRQSSGLAPLGQVETGMEYIENLDKYDTVTIEME